MMALIMALSFVPVGKNGCCSMEVFVPESQNGICGN
jgi:hypothetical protein